MKICFPVDENKGLESRIHGRFGTAGLFLLVDSETRQIEEMGHHDPLNGPLWNFGGWHVDAIVAGNIGARTLAELSRAGLKVYQARKATVAENLEVMAKSELPELTAQALGQDLDAGFRSAAGLGRGSGQGLGFGAGRGAGRCGGRGAGRGTGLGLGRGAGRGCRY
jgi:predicted Fe-Mo cluster-binding NifX family protein